MIVELGHFALTLGLVVACIQMFIPLIGSMRGDQTWMAVAQPAAMIQFFLILSAFLSLTYAYIVSDFSVANVIANSHSAKPLIYKISGVWGNHEGSMVLWVLILAFYGMLFSIVGRRLPLDFSARVLAIQATIAVGFLGFILLTSNPFLRVDPPRLDGNGLNPLLQDIGLALHPPLLYLGYVGFSLTFSFAIAALIEGRVDSAWARWLHPWTLIAWGFLTLGIGLGSWWAYYTLGWGGWWFWDPVENASLMPWLIGTALLHARVVVEKRNALKSWTVLLAIATFGLSLIGTFLVRSGILTSVHTFAVDAERGVYILGLVTFFIGGGLILYMFRASRLHDIGLFAPLSREGALMFNNLLLSTSAIVVFIGTLYPIFLEVLEVGRVSVGPSYYNITVLPLLIAVAIAMTVGPRMEWKRSDLRGLLSRLKMVLLITVLAVLIVFVVRGDRPLMGIVGMGLAMWVLGGVATDIVERLRLFSVPLVESWRRARHLPRSLWGTSIAHAAVGIVIAGMTGSSAWVTERIVSLKPQEEVFLAGYRILFEQVESVQGANYRGHRGTFGIWRDGVRVGVVYPERRLFTVSGVDVSHSAIRTTGFSDVMAVLGDHNAEGYWTVRLFHYPFVPFLWLGGIFMAFGAVVSLSHRFS